MMTTDVIFYVLVAVSAVLACLTVGVPNTLHSAINLMGVLCASAGFYFLIGAEFLGGVQILVYVGGIVVLLVFAVMLTRSGDLEADRPSFMRALLGFVGAASFFFISTFLVKQSAIFDSAKLKPAQDDVRRIGVALLDSGAGGFVLPFEMISLLLLAVLIGGLVLARKET